MSLTARTWVNTPPPPQQDPKVFILCWGPTQRVSELGEIPGKIEGGILLIYKDRRIKYIHTQHSEIPQSASYLQLPGPGNTVLTLQARVWNSFLSRSNQPRRKSLKTLTLEVQQQVDHSSKSYPLWGWEPSTTRPCAPGSEDVQNFSF